MTTRLFSDVANSSKFVGRVGWGFQFDPWVDSQVPFEIDPDYNPCGFQVLCEKPFADIGVDRIALHFSQSCPPELVDHIDFVVTFPLVEGEQALQDSDLASKSPCLDQSLDESRECVDARLLQKTAEGSDSGNDLGLLLSE